MLTEPSIGAAFFQHVTITGVIYPVLDGFLIWEKESWLFSPRCATSRMAARLPERGVFLSGTDPTSTSQAAIEPVLLATLSTQPGQGAGPCM